MKLNNKGFAISSMLYSILLLFLMLIVGVLAILGNRKVILDKVKNEIITDLIQNKVYSFSFAYKDILLANTSKVSGFSFDLLDDVKLVDQNGNVIQTEITTTSAPTFDATKNGTYVITYRANYQGNVIEEERTIEVIDPIIYEYVYTGREQQFTAPTNGFYQMELWGAQGGSSILDGGERVLNSPYCEAKGYCYGGAGAYTSGEMNLMKDTNLYLHVGGQGQTGVVNGVAAGGYNGGGTGDYDHSDNESDGGGGGATDIRLTSGSWNSQEGLRSRIMVAGGGGGAHDAHIKPGAAGGLSSPATAVNMGATQTAGYGFGIGENGVLVRKNYPLAGAGGGYYGGYSKDGTGWNVMPTGGSSYISGHTGSVAITSSSNQSAKPGCSDGTTDITCSYHYSGFNFSNTIMKGGEEVMPTHDGTATMTGNTGNGYAKITALIIENGKVATNLVQNSGFEMDSMEKWPYSSHVFNTELVSSTSVSGLYSLKMIVHSSSTKSDQPYQLISTVVGHKYYGIAYTNTNVADPEKTLTRITFSPGSEWTWLQYSDSTSKNRGEWMKHSILYQNPSYESLKFRISLGGNPSGTTIGDYYYIDNAMVLDLTEIYGEGNEPSKEWCDANIGYFDGVGIVPKY